MSLTLDLPGDLDRKLGREAKRQGAPMNELVAALLERTLAHQVKPRLSTSDETARSSEYFRRRAEEAQAGWNAMTDEEKAEAEEGGELKRAFNAKRLAAGAFPLARKCCDTPRTIF